MKGFDPFANQGGAAALGDDGAGDAARLDDLLNRVGSPPSLEPDTSFHTRRPNEDADDGADTSDHTATEADDSP